MPDRRRSVRPIFSKWPTRWRIGTRLGVGLGVGLAVALLAGLRAHAAGEVTLAADIELTPCTIGSGAAGMAAQCAQVNVPLNPADEADGHITLAVARIPARRRSSHQDAFTLLAGGPGQSAIDTFPTIASAFRHILRDRDVILIDQRGTGESAPLNCPQPRDALSPGLDAAADADSMRKAAKECLDQLTHDPRHFTTSVAVQDLERLRQRLGVSQWNLYGISYGTRVALHYLRRYPDKVRSVILDAVVPPTVALGPDIAPLAQRSLDLIFQRCSASSACAAAFPDIAEDTKALLASLRESPRRISYEHLSRGRMEQMDFTWQHLAITLRLMSYNAQTAALLPSMLHEAIHNDNFAPLARQALLQAESVGGSMATGMHNAVICSEDAPRMVHSARSVAPEVTPEHYPANPVESYMGDGVVDALLTVCAQWPAGLVDADFHEPVVSSVPTLILSGDADPITPPDYGESVAGHLDQSLHIVNPHQGHMQAPFGCMPGIMAHFIDSASLDTLDTGCLSRLHVPPFFVDANGPLP